MAASSKDQVTEGRHTKPAGCALRLRVSWRPSSRSWWSCCCSSSRSSTGITDSNCALNIMTQAGLYAIITIAVGLVLGQAGQLSFGHTAFYGIGAYVCGLLVHKFDVPTLWPGSPARRRRHRGPHRRPSGAQAQVLLPGSGHHGPGADIPGHRARVEMGRRLQRLRPGEGARTSSASRSTPRCASTTWSGSSASSSCCSSRACSSTGWAGRSRPRRQRDRVLHSRRAQRQLEAQGLRLQRGVLRHRRRPVRLHVRAVSPQNFMFSASVLPIVMMLVGGDRSSGEGSSAPSS